MVYHINPETGNANQCRARKQCRFGDQDHHYNTLEEAQKAFEASMELSAISTLRKQKMSKGAKLLVAIDQAQHNVVKAHDAIEVFTKSKSDDEVIYAKVHKDFNTAVKIRDQLQKKIKDLPWDESDAGFYDGNEMITLPEAKLTGKKKRTGYSNEVGSLSKEEKSVYEQLDIASGVWLRRLSTAEVKAVIMYNEDAEDYAVAMASTDSMEKSHDWRKYLHTAIAKAPRTEKPFRTFAGISSKRTLAMRQQCEAGNLELNRIQSSSFNPAQVNGFMQDSEPGAKDEMTIEFETTTVASLSAFNVHRGEMELLIPPGEYKVQENLGPTTYIWSKHGLGMTSAYTFVVKALDKS